MAREAYPPNINGTPEPHWPHVIRSPRHEACVLGDYLKHQRNLPW